MFHSQQSKHEHVSKNRVSSLFTRSLHLLLLLTSSNNPGPTHEKFNTALILLNSLGHSWRGQLLHCCLPNFVSQFCWGEPFQYLVMNITKSSSITCYCSSGAVSLVHPGVNKHNCNNRIKPVASIEYKKQAPLTRVVKIYIMVMTHWVLSAWAANTILNSKWQVKFICLYF